MKANDEHANDAQYERRLDLISTVIEQLRLTGKPTAVKPYEAFRENPRPPTTVGKKLFTAAAVYVYQILVTAPMDAVIATQLTA